MKLATISLPDGATRAARVQGETCVLLDEPDLDALLRTQDWRRSTGREGETLPTASVRLCAPVRMPAKVICVGLNYRAHIVEMNREMPQYPTLFTKFADTLIGPCDDIVLPPISNAVDWEGELAVVIGSEIHRADVAAAASSIAGYTIANDISLRDWQKRTTQWQQGKIFDRTTPIGPVLVTPDEFDPRGGACLRTRIGGGVIQEGRVDDLVFDVPELLSYISGITRLRPGDIVLTGTPGGVGSGFTPPRSLADGDEVEVEIDGIGRLSNRYVVRES